VAADFPGRLSVAAIDLTTTKRYDFRPRDPYLPASTFKLPVTLCTLEAIDRGELSWTSTIEYTRDDYEPVGAGAFETAPFGGRYSVRNLVDRSLISSNNVAVKMLARTLTWEGLARCTEALGGMVTRTDDGSTPVTAPDEAAWWQALWQMHQNKPALAENLLVPLRQVPYRGRIQAGTPRSDLVTHKFGTYPPYENDGAIIWAERPYILVVMTYGGDHLTVDQPIMAIAEAAWRSATAIRHP
jgi:beta-lactamase class A